MSEELIEIRIPESDANEIIRFVQQMVDTEVFLLLGWPPGERLIEEIRRAVFEASQKRRQQREGGVR